MTTHADTPDCAAIGSVDSAYGHTFLPEDGSEVCLICGATYRLVADPAEPSHGRYCAANGDDPLTYSGDTGMTHGYPGERCDANTDHNCNCIRCA
jgi:hypothetical protein